MEVLRLMLHEISAKEIAQRLHINPKTIHSDRTPIVEKLQVENKAALMHLVIKEELLTPNEIRANFYQSTTGM